MHGYPISPSITMAEMIIDWDWGDRISVARRIGRCPITQSCPISALSKLTVSSLIASPSIQEGLPSSTHYILADAIKAVRGMAGWEGQRIPPDEFEKGLP